MVTKRRKGEKPVVHEPLLWSESSTVARAIRTGDGWLYAWVLQQNVPVAQLSRGSGLTIERLDTLWRGAPPSDEELIVLAEPLRTDAASLAASVDYANAIKKR